ncbi:uncharacterized protein ACHE_20547A [Aspergillus chevalieri]|uniref:Uncharacterized protein n=1 Tax=Aspergillus chevalieri TaxID=182096 RepID=A0A7R7VJR7_ASPCH|nr:uncharacterized protein ACHE_20547A [Aspergillus chevalieri]BCR85089.1 hypothetical protein ACHE_20547A [Aspergillus chevalieri]
MARFSLSVLALCLFLAVFATALPAAQNNRPDPNAWAFHMAEEMADSTSPTPAHGPATSSHARLHAPASSSATPSKASPSASPTPSSSSSPAPPQETINGGETKSAFDSIPILGPLLGSLLGGK